MRLSTPDRNRTVLSFLHATVLGCGSSSTRPRPERLTPPPPDSPLRLVFTETTLSEGLALDVGRTDDPSWQAAARRQLDVVAGLHGGAVSETAAWHELLAWLQADHTLGSFLERVFQALDATTWLLAAAMTELNDAGVVPRDAPANEGDTAEFGDVVHAFQKRLERIELASDDGRRG